jgi:hypothetical protein
MKVKAKKDGQFDDGDFFAYKGEIYYAIEENWSKEEGGKYYYVESEFNDHGMEKEMFDQYFEIIKKE